MPFNSLTEINGNMLGQIRKHCHTAMCFLNDKHRIFDRFTSSLLFSSCVICHLVSHLPHCAGSTVMFLCVSCTYSSSMDRGWIRLKDTPRKERKAVLLLSVTDRSLGPYRRDAFPCQRLLVESLYLFLVFFIEWHPTNNMKVCVFFRDPNH